MDQAHHVERSDQVHGDPQARRQRLRCWQSLLGECRPVQRHDEAMDSDWAWLPRAGSYQEHRYRRASRYAVGDAVIDPASERAPAVESSWQ